MAASSTRCPATTSRCICFYNKDVFSQNGWKRRPIVRSCEQVADAALAKGIIPFGAGNADWKGVNEWLVTVFFQ